MATENKTETRTAETIHSIQHIEISASDPVKMKTFLEKQDGCIKVVATL